MFKNKRKLKYIRYSLALSMMSTVAIMQCSFAAEKQGGNQVVQEAPKDGNFMPPPNFEPPEDKDGNPLPPPPCCKQMREGERPEPPKDKDGKPIPPPKANGDYGEDCPEPPKDENGNLLSPPNFVSPKDESGNPLPPPNFEPPTDEDGRHLPPPPCHCEKE